MGPLIGIPPCLDEAGRWRQDRSYHYIDRAYADAVVEAGATPVYLPQQGDPVSLVGRVDGLLLPGGDDLPPPPGYPEDVEFEPVPESQRAFDGALLAAALESDLPVLAICYGMQLLALHHGGTLVHDIATERPECEPHRLPESGGRHAIQVTPGSRLADALGDAEPRVNSLHHQAVSEPGAGLRVVARAEDQLPEAIEREAAPFCLGVQWHPEKMRGPHRERLFAAFAAACAAARPR
jgi:gamma-glutamyl-gamma-aminobutyrate hydrolase PuuD